MTIKSLQNWVEPLIRPQCRGFEPYMPGRSIDSVRRERGLSRLYKLASNENAMGPSPLALRALTRVGKAYLRYPDGPSTSLRQAVSKKFGVSAERVIIGAGSDELIELLGKTFLNPGDSIVVSDHAFIRYRMAGELMGATVLSVPMRSYTHDLTAMAKAIRPDTKILFIANPNNPTGTYNSQNELVDLLNYVAGINRQEKRQVLVVEDEAYYEYASALAQNYPKTVALQKKFPNLIVLRTFSKIYALAGLRVGYGFAEPEIISALDRVRPPFNVSTAAQVAAEASLKDRGQMQRGVRLVLQGRRQLLPALAQMGFRVVPSIGNFVLIDVAPRRGTDLFNALLDRGVIVRAMDEYGFPNFIRVTYGLPEENRWFLKVLKEVVVS